MELFNRLHIDEVSKRDWNFYFFIFLIWLKKFIPNHISPHHAYVNHYVHIAQPFFLNILVGQLKEVGRLVF